MIKFQNYKYLQYLIFLSLVFIFLTSCEVFLSNRKDLNENRLRTAIKINPSHELGYIRFAQYLEKKHRYSETLSILRAGQKNIPNSMTLIRLEGSLLQGLDYEKEAIIFYAKQILRHPNNELLYLDRSKMRWNRGKKYLALTDARKALKIKPDSFDALYLIGLILSQNLDKNSAEKNDKALETLILASEINDKDSDIWFRISALWENKKNIHLAKKAMLKAIEISPESESYLKRLTLLLEKELDETSSENSFNISETLRKTLVHMVKLFPQNSWVHAHYGNWAWTQENYYLAEKHLKIALNLNPEYPWAYFRLAIIYLSQNKWQLALSSLKEGLKYEPGNEWALLKIGLTLELQEKNEDAIIHYEKLMDTFPVKLMVVDRLSKLYWKNFLFTKGEKILLTGIKHFPLETKLIEILVNYYESIGLYENAKNILYSFIKLEPNNSAALAKIGFFEKKQNKLRDALKYFNKALEINPEFEWAHIQKIEILVRTKDFKQAEKELNSFLKNKPNTEWALLELSKIKIRNKQFTSAENILKKDLIKIKNSPMVLNILGKLYKIQKRWEEAERTTKEILRQEPNNSISLTNLSYFQWKLNKINLAKANSKKALYENKENFLAWNLHFILQSKSKQMVWIEKDFKEVLPVLKSLANQNSTSTWDIIKSTRTDPFTLQILKNLHYLNQGFEEEIFLEPEDMTSQQNSPWIHERWGYFHEILGNLDIAAKHLEIASKKIPKETWIHARLGSIYEKLERNEKSLYHYNKFLKKNPNAYEINFRLANIQLLLGNEKSTINIYEKIISARPNNDLVLNNLAWILLTAQNKKLRNIKKALKLALKSVEIFPTIDNLDTLAEAYFQSGKVKEAINILRKATIDVNYPVKRQPYLRKQFLRFKKGDPNTNPPSLF